MNQLISLIIALVFILTPASECKTTVTKIHEDDQITVLVNYKGRVKEEMLHGYDFNIPVLLSETIPTEIAKGKFVQEFPNLNKVNNRKYYKFRSYDNEVWWELTEEDIGFVPSYEKEYTIIYCVNGTTKENKPCDCIPEWECECEVYDDVFITIYEEERK